MKDLQEFLSSPKLRGNIGEQVLKELLKQFLPKESFDLQYTFKSGEKVDAAIKTSGGIIPVDSKFPMENFRKMSGDGDDASKKLQVMILRGMLENTLMTSPENIFSRRREQSITL